MARSRPTRSVLGQVDPGALDLAARRESRSRQNHLPPVTVYRWWARRTEAVSGALVDALMADRPGSLFIADPFAGGGVIALAALLRGLRVYAQDVNPWAARNLATMLDLPSVDELSSATDRLRERVAPILETAYATALANGSPGKLSTTLRVAKAPCPECGTSLRLFPAALVSLTRRVDCGGDTGYLACPAGHLSEGSSTEASPCPECGRFIDPSARYTAGRAFTCADCASTSSLADLAGSDGFDWDVVLVGRVGSSGREMAIPNAAELAMATSGRWKPKRQLPPIVDGPESRVLVRHGMRRWHDLYPARQRVVVEALLDAIPEIASKERTARALEAAVIGSTEMAGHASRWDSRYLKAYEVIANHRFSFTTLAAEPNVWGANPYGRGGVERRLEHFAKASAWLEERIGRPINVDGPVPATDRRKPLAPSFDVRVVVGTSERLQVPVHSFDAVLTDPPYHDDVQYGELSSLFRAWAGQDTGQLTEDAAVVRHSGAIDDYEERLTKVFAEIFRALKPGGHLVLSYANRHPPAWVALFSALQRAGFKAIGFAVVHSENETDHAKAGRRACNLDVLIDLVHGDQRTATPFVPAGEPCGEEEAYCRQVGKHALRIGNLRGNWKSEVEADLGAMAFLRSDPPVPSGVTPRP